uniref:Uncharacterized protein n=1 Tax=Sphenodon punctatus TaxID=8508 RepID=A0A8D0L969_SPHPU
SLFSSSGLNTSTRVCTSYPSHCSDLSDTNTPLPVLSRNRGILQQSCDSGISSPLPSDSCKYLTWRDLEGHDVRGSQIRCPRVRAGKSENLLKVLLNLNLSFQDLGDPYQLENFNKILWRLIRVERLWLVDNSLTDLSAIRLPRCTELNVNKNHFTSFKQLPKIPQIQHLSLTENNIETLNGISFLRHTPLESLILKRNPCEFQENYRQL